MRAKQKVRSALSKYQRILASKPGVLGNGAGIVDDPKRTGYSFVRIAGAPAISVINKRCASIDGLYVWVGYDPVEPDILQILSIRGIQKDGISGIGTALGVAKHGITHQWMNRDTTWIHLRQMIPFRPTPAGGMMLKIGEGISFIGDSWVGNTGATVNMSPYIPAAGAQYAQIYMNSNGLLDVVTGEVKTLNTLIASDIPAPIPGTMPIAAVRLYPGMSTIAESRIASDLVDLRWLGPYESWVGSTGSAYNHNPVATFYPHKDYLLTGSSYYPLDTRPAQYTGESISALISGSSTFYLGGFITAPEGLGATEITAGTWTLGAKVFFSVTDPLGMSASAKVYSVSTGTVETELFNGTIGTHDVDHLLDQDFSYSVSQPVFALNPTDRLLIKYYITGVASSYGFTSIGLGPWDGTKVIVPPLTKPVSGGNLVLDFTDLADVPANYVGQAGKTVAVNATETGLEFTTLTIPASGNDLDCLIDGRLIAHTDVWDWIVGRVGQISSVLIYCKSKGTAGSTIIDINKNGTSIFTTQANRPTLAYNSSSSVVSGVPDIISLAANDILSLDIDSVATGASGLAALISMELSTLPDEGGVVSSILQDMLAYFRFEEATGATRLDSIDSYNLTDHNSVTGTETGIAGVAAGFTAASSQYLSQDSNSDFNIVDGQSFCIGLWIYLDSAAYGVMFSKWATNYTGLSYILQNNSSFIWQVHDSGSGSYAATCGDLGAPSTGTWYWIVVGYDGVRKEIFIIGNNRIHGTTPAPTLLDPGVSNFLIGANGSFTSYFSGRIDEMAIWKGRMPTPAELFYLYNAGAGRSYANISAYTMPTNPEWNHSWALVGEHPIINNQKLYVNGGDVAATGYDQLTIYSPATGEIYKRIATPYAGGAAVAIDSSGYIHVYAGNGGKVYKINEDTGTIINTLSGLTTIMDWECLVYDSEDGQIFVPYGNHLRSVFTSNYLDRWTNNDVTYTTDASDHPIAPVLLVGSYVYALGTDRKVVKVNKSTGATVNSHTLSTGTINSYAQMIYDEDSDLIYASDGAGCTVFALDPDDLSVAWSKNLEASGYTIFRGGAYHSNVLYMTSRQNSTPYRSKVYALDTLSSGTVLWTNTTAYDNNAQVSSLLVDNDYVYCTTYDYNAGTYNRVFGLALADGSVSFNYNILTGASSSIPAVWAGKFFIGLWNSLGIQAIALRVGGNAGNFPWKGSVYRTGYVGSYTSGALVSH